MGERCGLGQFGPVLFLPGNRNPSNTREYERTCVVAEGIAIYGTLGAACSTIEPPPFFGRTEDELRACAAEWTDQIIDVSATVNGGHIDLHPYRASSPLFTVTFPEENIFFEEVAAVGDAVSDVYSLLIAPPPPGEHEITLSVRNFGQAEPFDLIYNLIVEPPLVIEPPTT
jgi:hypothetical protein